MMMIAGTLEASSLILAVFLKMIQFLALVAHSCLRCDISFDFVKGAIHEDAFRHQLLHFCFTIHKCFDRCGKSSILRPSHSRAARRVKSLLPELAKYIIRRASFINVEDDDGVF